MWVLRSHGDYNADLNPGSRPAFEVVINPHSPVNLELIAFLFVSTSVGTMGANRGQHWSDTRKYIAALLDVWGDDKIQTQLNGAYRNDSVLQKIAAALANSSIFCVCTEPP